MSITVEDLVSSLSSSHIGQEAIDIATLQAQLAQTLFGQPSSSSGRQVPRTYTQPCNTPTARTRSASFSSWGQMASDQQFMANSNSVLSASTRVTDEYSRNSDDMEDDERMVEELLIPSSPMSIYPTPSHHYMSSNSYAPPGSPPYFTTGMHSTHPPVSEQGSSLFTSTDPFYMAQAQAAQNYSSSQQSVFAQSGNPSQASPFIRQQQFYQHNRRENHGYIHPNPPSLTLDTHTFFAQTSAAF